MRTHTVKNFRAAGVSGDGKTLTVEFLADDGNILGLTLSIEHLDRLMTLLSRGNIAAYKQQEVIGVLAETAIPAEEDVMRVQTARTTPMPDQQMAALQLLGTMEATAGLRTLSALISEPVLTGLGRSLLEAADALRQRQKPS